MYFVTIADMCYIYCKIRYVLRSKQLYMYSKCYFFNWEILVFLKNYAVTIGKQSLSQSMHHTHCFSVSNPVIWCSIIEYIFSILERSLSDPWAILERNTHKHNENASFLPQGSIKDRSRIAQGSISMVSRIDFEWTLVYTD